ncbi:cyclase family protein [Zhenpiania hominis]|uniref:cyclase family protein n=1 Tax=Zhenpiania hominis TaxID=2763644 RepID=UPI0039F49872
MKIIDLSCTYKSGQIAGNPKRHPVVALKRMGRIEDVGFNTSSILLGSHTGTHIDAPLHFFADGTPIDKIDLNLCCGPVTTVDFRRFGPGSRVEPKDVSGLKVSSRMLFVFGWDQYYDSPQYQKDWPYFSLEAVQYLYDKGMRLMVMDTISPDCAAKGGPEDFQIHKTFFPKGVTFIELIVNTKVIDFSIDYQLFALPLKLQDLDGSPCRVILTADEN